MSQLNYTVGNWTVASHEVDTISATKTVAIPDLDFAHDFSVSAETAKGTDLLNTSGTALEPVERLRYFVDKVADIYRTTDVAAAAKLPSSAGKRISAENTEVLSLANSVSGAELDVPIRIWTCVESSTHQAITGTALLWALLRHFSALFDTGSTSDNMLVKLFRGDTDPTR
jgi:hypothetical protein